MLAEKLGVTDRAVSKWENGKCLPDAAIMLDLCKILKITVNDLLCGERITMENYNKQLEENLIEITKQKQELDKKLLSLEILIGVFSCIILFGFVFTAAFALTLPIRFDFIGVLRQNVRYKGSADTVGTLRDDTLVICSTVHLDRCIDRNATVKL